MRAHHVQSPDVGRRIDAYHFTDRRIRTDQERPHPSQRRHPTQLARNLDATRLAQRHDGPSSTHHAEPGRGDRAESHQRGAPLCAVRHGSAAGDASASAITKELFQKPPQLTTEGVEDNPEGESFRKIKHGIRLTGVPAFGQTLSDQPIWTLALFLKRMDKLPPPAQQDWQQVQNWTLAPKWQPRLEPNRRLTNDIPTDAEWPRPHVAAAASAAAMATRRHNSSAK